MIVVESRVTHSGKKKGFLFVERDRQLCAPYIDKVSVCMHVLRVHCIMAQCPPVKP